MIPFEPKTQVLGLTDEQEQQRQNLIYEFDCHYAQYGKSQFELGRILFELKPLYVKIGRKGEWSGFLKHRGIPISTADDWIRKYKKRAGIPQSTGKKGHRSRRKGRKGNVTGSGTLPTEPYVDLSGKPFKDKKEIVEAIFVLTEEQKRKFIDAVQELGPAAATQIMYQFVVHAAETAKRPATATRFESIVQSFERGGDAAQND